MAKKGSSDKTLTKSVTKALPCTLTEQEVLAYGRDMAHAYAERERIDGEFDAVKSDYKGKLAEQDAIIGKLSGRVHSGIETREVKCEQIQNWTEATITVLRCDTREVIESRPMREDEKAMELSLDVGTSNGDASKE
jgi:hypothetical protein